MITRDDLPATPDWAVEPHACPIPCAYCSTTFEAVEMPDCDLGEN